MKTQALTAFFIALAFATIVDALTCDQLYEDCINDPSESFSDCNSIAQACYGGIP